MRPQPAIRHINYHSDFKELVTLSGDLCVGVPFKFTYTSGKFSRNPYVASWDGKDDFLNCKIVDKNHVWVYFSQHNLQPGLLHVKREFFAKDEDFYDGVYNFVTDEPLGVELWDKFTDSDNATIASGVILDALRGYSAYEIAKSRGFEGTEEEWVESLKGVKGESAYDIAVRHGFEGTEAEWLESIGAAQNALVEKYEELRQENELLKQKLDEQEALNAEQQDEIDRLKNYDQTQDENLDAATKLATSEAVRGLFSK